jgi:hypothetical protein
MVTKETIEAALVTSERRWNGGNGWFTNGHFAVKGEQWLALATENRPDVARCVADWSKLEKEPVLEAVELRIATITKARDCKECTDGKWTHDECDDCQGHDCYACDGGKVKASQIGQMVFTADGKDTVVDPALGALLEGLTIFRDSTCDRAISMLMGYDNGEFVVAVMPRDEPVRR